MWLRAEIQAESSFKRVWMLAMEEPEEQTFEDAGLQIQNSAEITEANYLL